MTVAKALGGGLPIGALITNERFAEGFEPGDHGSTFAGGPVQCAAGLAVLDIVSDPALLARVRETGERIRHVWPSSPASSRSAGRGFMLAAELDPARAEPATELVGRALRDERLVLNATGPTTLRLLPPLTISDAELDDALARLGRLLTTGGLTAPWGPQRDPPDAGLARHARLRPCSRRSACSSSPLPRSAPPVATANAAVAAKPRQGQALRRGEGPGRGERRLRESDGAEGRRGGRGAVGAAARRTLPPPRGRARDKARRGCSSRPGAG